VSMHEHLRRLTPEVAIRTACIVHDGGAAIAREIGLEKVMFEADLALFGWSIQN
jgi:hypothetical protein